MAALRLHCVGVCILWRLEFERSRLAGIGVAHEAMSLRFYELLCIYTVCGIVLETSRLLCNWTIILRNGRLLRKPMLLLPLSRLQRDVGNFKKALYGVLGEGIET